MKKETKELMKLFCLNGKVTDEHAEEIEEILESFLTQANKAGGLRMLRMIADDEKKAWREGVEDIYKDKFLKELK